MKNTQVSASDIAVREYEFDVKMFASIKIRAGSKAQAWALLKENACPGVVDFGSLPNNARITGRVVIDDDEMVCLSVDGNPV